jgi:thioredoxin-related protein
MEQLKDFRLTSTPRIVWIVCICLLVARIALSAYEFAHPAAKQRSVAWIDANLFYGFPVPAKQSGAHDALLPNTGGAGASGANDQAVSRAGVSGNNDQAISEKDHGRGASRAPGPEPSNAHSASENASAKPANHKRRIYEFYASWCSPCERLERDVMTNSEIRTYIEGNFCPIRVVDRQREDGHNNKLVSELQKRYRVFAFPTLVATKEDGEALGSLVGNSSSLAVYRFLSRVKNDEGSAK